MPVQPRFRVKFLLKFKYENVVRLAFQKKFYSKTRMDGHITIREKSVLPEVFNNQDTLVPRALFLALEVEPPTSKAGEKRPGD